MLRLAGIGGLGLLLGAGGVGTAIAARGAVSASGAGGDSDSPTVPFYGAHQAGIVTPSQNFLVFASFDLTTEHKSDIVAMMKRWTDASSKMCVGVPVGKESSNTLLPPTDTGEAQGLLASWLTLTFGAGPSLFDARYGLTSIRPAELVDFPAFAGEELRKEWCGGDLCAQACADDLQVVFHAIRNLARIARGTAVLRWTQEGFQRTGQADPPFFICATVLIYYLVFKFLGESIHALQIAGQIPSHVTTYLFAVSWLGVYPTWETILPQLALLAALVIVFLLKPIDRWLKRDTGKVRA